MINVISEKKYKNYKKKKSTFEEKSIVTPDMENRVAKKQLGTVPNLVWPRATNDMLSHHAIASPRTAMTTNAPFLFPLAAGIIIKI